MALDNYKVVYEDGSETYFQFEDGDEGLKAFRDAASDKNQPVASVSKGNPSPINPK